MSATRTDRDQALEQRVIVAASTCVERLGLAATTVDDIAAESGISRATLYRKFGNKEAILDALIGQHAAPFATEAVRILMGPGNIALRIEEAMLCGVMGLPDQPWLDGPLGTSLFHDSYRQRTKAVLHLILQSPDVRAGLELEEVLDWFMRELMLMVAARPWDEGRLRRRIRDFVVPVLVPDCLRGAAPQT